MLYFMNNDRNHIICMYATETGKADSLFILPERPDNHKCRDKKTDKWGYLPK